MNKNIWADAFNELEQKHIDNASESFKSGREKTNVIELKTLEVPPEKTISRTKRVMTAAASIAAAAALAVGGGFLIKFVNDNKPKVDVPRAETTGESISADSIYTAPEADVTYAIADNPIIEETTYILDVKDLPVTEEIPTGDRVDASAGLYFVKADEAQEEPDYDRVPSVFPYEMPTIFYYEKNITRPFGYDEWSGNFHHGVDFACAVGTPVLAAANGIITEIVSDSNPESENPEKGNYITITHSGGIKTTYANLLSPADGLSVGDEVKAGTVIAKSGNSGNSTGPHLHFEVMSIDTYINPVDFLQDSFDDTEDETSFAEKFYGWFSVYYGLEMENPNVDLSVTGGFDKNENLYIQSLQNHNITFINETTMPPVHYSANYNEQDRGGEVKFYFTENGVMAIRAVPREDNETSARYVYYLIRFDDDMQISAVSSIPAGDFGFVTEGTVITNDGNYIIETHYSDFYNSLSYVRVYKISEDGVKLYYELKDGELDDIFGEFAENTILAANISKDGECLYLGIHGKTANGVGLETVGQECIWSCMLNIKEQYQGSAATSRVYIDSYPEDTVFFKIDNGLAFYRRGVLYVNSDDGFYDYMIPDISLDENCLYAMSNNGRYFCTARNYEKENDKYCKRVIYDLTKDLTDTEDSGNAQLQSSSNLLEYSEESEIDVTSAKEIFISNSGVLYEMNQFGSVSVSSAN